MSANRPRQQELDQSPLSPHISITCGQSRRGGVRTSNSRRRSISFGQVSVAHVQLDKLIDRVCTAPSKSEPDGRKLSQARHAPA